MLRASCESAEAYIFIAENNFIADHFLTSEEEQSSVRLHLRNVPPTCSYSDITQPCHPHAGYVPPMWHCTWAGDAKSIVLGPYQTNRTEHLASDRQVLSMDISLECPLPSKAVALHISGYGGTDAPLLLTVGAAHGLKNDSLTLLPFRGPAAGNVLRFSGITPPQAPPVSPPPSPPAPPPSPTPPLPPPPPPSPNPPRTKVSCEDWYQNGARTSGTYKVTPPG